MKRPDATGVAVMVLAVTVPYLTKPIHMDGPVTLAMARHILSDPLDPLGYTIHWDGRVHRGYELNNPPLTGYLVAAAVALGGAEEVPAHLAESLMTLVAAAAMYGLARRFSGRPLPAVGLLVCSPAFIPSQNVMFDVTLVALWLAALWAWVTGVDAGRWSRVWLGAGLAGLAILTKYSGLVLVPLLAVYALGRRRYRALAALVLPVAIVAAWAWHNVVWYGEAHLFSRPTPAPGFLVSADRFLATVKVLGAVTLAGLAAPWLLRGMSSARRSWLGGLGLVAAAGGATALTWIRLLSHETFMGKLERFASQGQTAYAVNVAVTLSVMTVLGALALAGLVVATVRAWRRPEVRHGDLFLWLWIAAVIGFNVVASPFLAIRNLLPAVAGLALLFVRCWERSTADRPWLGRWGLRAVVALTAVVGFAVAEADRATALAYCRAAHRVADRHTSAKGRLWTTGYWTWQWCAARSGLRDLHRDTLDETRPGDLLAVPLDVHGNSSWMELGCGQPAEVEPVPIGAWPLRTVSNYYRIGFYRTELDDVPYIVSRIDPLPILIFRIPMKASAGGAP